MLAENLKEVELMNNLATNIHTCPVLLRCNRRKDIPNHSTLHPHLFNELKFNGLIKLKATIVNLVKYSNETHTSRAAKS